jgi:hypothetical protein
MTDPGGADKVLATLLGQYLPSWVGAIILIGILGVAMSTVSSIIPITAFSIVHDVWKGIFKPSLSENEEVKWTRIVMAVAGLLTVIIAVLKLGTIALIGVWAAAIGAASLFPTLALAPNWKRMNSTAAIISMLGGFGLAILMSLKIIPRPFGLDMTYFTVPFSFLLLIIFSLVLPTPENEAQCFMELERITQERKQNLPPLTKSDYIPPYLAIIIPILFLLLFGGGLVFPSNSGFEMDIFWAITYSVLIPVASGVITIIVFNKQAREHESYLTKEWQTEKHSLSKFS